MQNKIQEILNNTLSVKTIGNENLVVSGIINASEQINRLFADASKEEPKGLEELRELQDDCDHAQLLLTRLLPPEEHGENSDCSIIWNALEDAKNMILPHLSGVSNTKSSDAEIEELIEDLKDSQHKFLLLLPPETHGEDSDCELIYETLSKCEEFLKFKGITPVEDNEESCPFCESKNLIENEPYTNCFDCGQSFI